MKFRHWLKWKFNPPLVINISGKARHGKDTFGRFLMYRLKSDYGLKVQRISSGDVLKDMTRYPSRSFLQQLGMFLRATRGNDYLISRAFAKYNGADVVIITDTRFPNEISYFENAPQVTIRVDRICQDKEPYESDLTPEQKAHPSETALDDYKFDIHIQAKNVRELKEASERFAPICYDVWQRGFSIVSSDSYYWYT